VDLAVHLKAHLKAAEYFSQVTIDKNDILQKTTREGPQDGRTLFLKVITKFRVVGPRLLSFFLKKIMNFQTSLEASMEKARVRSVAKPK
jgi:hypothetical protein